MKPEKMVVFVSNKAYEHPIIQLLIKMIEQYPDGIIIREIEKRQDMPEGECVIMPERNAP